MPTDYGAYTSEHPIAPSAAAIIARTRFRYRLWFFAGATLVAVLLFAVAGRDFSPLTLLGPVVFVLAIIALVWLLIAEIPLARDARASTYLRTAGAVRIGFVAHSYKLFVADRVLFTKDESVVRVLRTLPWAAIDYTKHFNLIFEVRNRAGETLYCKDGYERGS